MTLKACGRQARAVVVALAMTLMAAGTAAADMTVDVSASEDIPRWYLFIIGERIQQQLGTVTIPAGRAALHIQGDGKITEVLLTRSSGVPLDDLIVLAAIRAAAPFPSLPPEDWRLVIQVDVRWQPAR